MAYSYKGALAFGLVYIPIKLHQAVKKHDIGFNMLDKKTLSRVKYIKTCTECGGRQVKQEDIVKGYEYDDGKYVIFDSSDFEKVKSKRDKNIMIEKFIDLSEIDPVYFETNYYIEPSGAEKAYSLLYAALKKENKAGITKTVLGTKESVVVVRAGDGVLILSTLNFADEIQKPSFTALDGKAGASEQAMASALIKSMSGKFNPQEYKDEYTEKLKKAIDAKIAGRKIARVSDEPDLSPKITDLMKALTESIKIMDKKQKPSSKIKTSVGTKTSKEKSTQKSKTAKRAKTKKPDLKIAASIKKSGKKKAAV